MQLGTALTGVTTYAMEIDKLDNLWLATSNGVLIRKSDGEIVKPFAHYFDTNLGYEHGVSTQTDSGEIVFAGVGGYIVFNPDKVDIVADTPRLVWSRIESANSLRIDSTRVRDTNHIYIN